MYILTDKTFMPKYSYCQKDHKSIRNGFNLDGRTPAQWIQCLL